MARYSDFTFGHAEAIFNMLGGEEAVRRILAGDRTVTVAVKWHIINLNLEPFYNDENFGVRKHAKGGEKTRGLFLWNPKSIELWRSDQQKRALGTPGDLLHGEMTKKHRLNACVGDYLLEHPELIPLEWEHYTVCFWGTLFVGRDKRHYVPAIQRRHGAWQSIYLPLKDRFTDHMPALISRTPL